MLKFKVETLKKITNKIYNNSFPYVNTLVLKSINKLSVLTESIFLKIFGHTNINIKNNFKVFNINTSEKLSPNNNAINLNVLNSISSKEKDSIDISVENKISPLLLMKKMTYSTINTTFAMETDAKLGEFKVLGDFDNSTFDDLDDLLLNNMDLVVT